MLAKLSLALAITAGTVFAQTPAAPPQTKGTTPSECLTEIRDYVAKRQQELSQISGLSSVDARQQVSQLLQHISQSRTAMARECAGRFDVQTIADRELPALIDLYTDAGQPELAKATVARAMAITTFPESDRANVLVQAVRTGLREPKSADRNTRLEKLVDELDRLSDAALDQKMSAHSAMNGYYRADDIDAGIVKHSTWLIETGKNSSPEQRKRSAGTILSAYINMAEAWAGHGRNDDALRLLRQAIDDWRDVPNTAARLQPTLDRYLLVGTPAAAITAPRWLNVPAGTSSLPMTGAVTLLEFTAHWCGPCKESYPGLKRMLARYGSQGFRVVFATQLYGYFETERNLTPEAEFERDREYFTKKEGFDVPIAVAERPPPKVIDGRSVYTSEPNDAAYRVGGIPQIHLIDRQGRIRLIMVGYDDANEPRLAKLIEELLKEAGGAGFSRPAVGRAKARPSF